ncbi:hypothetical protein, partial [Streptomyces albus]|uniref:hypothetical protein n=1 Tax=Streptomyces albus TaxID=1888 RepID=UPI000AF0DE2A
MSNDRTAELLAAVRAVESGERSADSFFTEPAPPARRPRPTGREEFGCPVVAHSSLQSWSG